MLCRNPFVRNRSGEVFTSPRPRDWLEGIPFRCGKCLACRVAIRREWTTRLILEMLSHDAGMGIFLTLTYSEDYCPVTDTGFRTLSKRDLQLFMKRFRINLERSKKRSYPIRFYACGEYGSRGTTRPHYHILLFGCSPHDKDVIDAINASWCEPAAYGQKGETPMFGTVVVEPLSAKTIAYTAGYVMKKLVSPRKRFHIITSSKDVGGKRYTFEKRVVDRKSSDRDDNGVQQEFRTMSRMPGLGFNKLFDFISLAKSSAAFRRFLLEKGDVPGTYRAFGRNLFFDRYVKTKLRELLGITPDPEPFYADVRNQFFTWLNDPALDHSSDFYEYLVHQDDQRYKQLVDRVKRQLQRRNKI